MKQEIIEEAIETYAASHLPHCQQIYMGQEITEQLVAAHKKLYAPMTDEEHVLLLVNKIPSGWRGRFFTGLCITDRFVYYTLMKDSFFTAFQRRVKGIVPLESVRNLAIGRTDHAYGPDYMGHQLLVDGRIAGLLKMGNGLMEVEKMVEQLQQLFKNFAHE